jgi:hypothetical protein
VNPQLHLEIAGWLLLALSAAHLCFWRYFQWGRELAAVSLLTRQVFGVHTFFIGLILAMFGWLSAIETQSLLAGNALSRTVLRGMLLFWACRLACQLFVYDRSLWRGRRLETSMHVLFTVLWGYLILVYGLALYRA